MPSVSTNRMPLDARHAHYKIRIAIRDGLLLRAEMNPCFMCGDAASEYHHFRGYTGDDAYRVLPLCRSCHRKVSSNVDTEKAARAAAAKKTATFFKRHKGHHVTVSVGKRVRNICVDCQQIRYKAFISKRRNQCQAA